MAAIMCGVLLSSLTTAGSPAPGDATVLVSFDRASLPENMRRNDAAAAMVAHKGRRAMRVKFHEVDWPNVFFTPSEGAWD